MIVVTIDETAFTIQFLIEKGAMMIRKLIPQPVKARLKTWLLHILREDLGLIMTQDAITIVQNELEGVKKELLPTAVTNYVPYEQGLDSFLIHKSPPLNGQDVCDLGLPVPPKELWIGFKTREQYLDSGEMCINKMLEVVEASDFSFVEGMRILDFGCGAGRMIRHLESFSEYCEIWGADISAGHIFWCKQYLDPPFHFVVTTMIPHLPFEDEHFDFIYAGSVFTHIDDLAVTWLLELKRILSRDGRLYITIHDRHTMGLLNTIYQDSEFSTWLRAHELYSESDDLGMLVLGRGADSQVFYDIEYFCDTLSSMYDILSVTQEAYGFQTALLLRRKAND